MSSVFEYAYYVYVQKSRRFPEICGVFPDLPLKKKLAVSISNSTALATSTDLYGMVRIGTEI